MPLHSVAAINGRCQTVLMKITKNTPDQLIIDHQPWGWGIGIAAFVLTLVAAGIATLGQGELFVGVILLLFAVFAGVVFRLIVVRNQMFFHAPLGIVEFRKRKIKSDSKKQFLLSDIKGATVQSLSKTHRVALVLNDGTEQPFTNAYFSGDGAQRAADAITVWLAHVDSLMNPD